MYLEYPSHDDWKRIASTYPFEKLQIEVNDFVIETGDIREFAGHKELTTWAVHLTNRIYDVYKSYVLAMYFFEKGIPDDPFFISPGEGGVSIQYFPRFKEIDFEIKDQFDFYVDMFYYKTFSAFDTLGHILNLRHNLGIEKHRVSFKSAVAVMEKMGVGSFIELTAIKNDAEFDKASALRNDIAHNFLPHSIGSGVRPSPKVTSFGVGGYTPSKTIAANMTEVLNLLARALESSKAPLATGGATS